MDLKQQNRTLAIDCSALPAGEVMVRRVDLREELSRPFRCEVEILAADGKLDFNSVVGQNATVSVLLHGDTLAAAGKDDVRHINGTIFEFEQRGAAGELFEYRASIVPDLWMLAQTRSCRIFKDMSVPDIVLQVLKEAGYTDVDNKVTGDYKPRWFCVQYRESTFDFVSRIMEEEGIYYFFEHEKGKHKMILCDDSSAHAPAGGLAEVPYGLQGAESVAGWRARQKAVPTDLKMRDYDWKQAVNMSRIDAEVSGEFPQSVGLLAVYDFPGSFTADTYPAAEGAAADAGSALAKNRMKELQAGVWEAEGRSANLIGLRAGCTFKLTGHPRQDFECDYLVTRLEISSTARIHRSTSIPDSEASMYCRFTAHALSAAGKAWAFRPRRITPKPLIPGLQTATVMGSSGKEEVWTDKWGRIQIRFHWDTEDAKDSTCWVRVAQMWAGAGFGSLFIPRVDQEVVVAFLEGDPDKPIVVGSLYNESNQPPHKLPDNASRSTIRTNSTPSNNSNAKFNEIRFEDKADKEEIYVHAQKDVKVEILNDRNTSIKHDEIFTVENDRTGTVKKNETLTVEANRTRTVKKDESVTIEGNGTRAVKKDDKNDVTGEFKESVGKDYKLDVGAELTVEAKNKITLKVGGSQLVMEPSKIVIKTGGSTITMAAAEVKVESTNITVKAQANANVEGGAAAKVKGGATASLEGAMADVKGTGKASVKGAVTMLG